ncbi:hypothetical protein N8521_03285, partial [Akkermansiaceae bacterium]|nr:hypothetical protein [Akkermansiaceae bacterium]
QITFGNQFIRKAVEDMHLPGDEDKRSAHRWLGEWFDKREVTPDVARERIHQWRHAEHKEKLRECLLEEKIVTELLRDERLLELYDTWEKYIGLDVDNVLMAYEKAGSQWANKNQLIYLRGYLKTLDEVGKQFEKTREELKQIDAKKLHAMRHPKRIRKLEDFIQLPE